MRAIDAFSPGALLLILTFGAACGAGAPDRPDPADPVIEQVTAPLQAGHRLQEQVYTHSVQVASIVAQGVFAASILGAQGQALVTHGTVTQAPEGARYAPEPADHLRILPSAGPALEVFVARFESANLQSPEAFFEADHHFEATVGIEGLEARYTSTRAGIQRTATIEGRARLERTLDLSLRYEGTEAFEIDSTGSSYESSSRIMGEASGEGFSAHLDETWRFELVVARSSSGSTSAQAAWRTINSRIMVGQDSYVWSGVRLQKSFKNGKPSDLDGFWTAEGAVLKNGAAFGRYRFTPALISPESGGFAKFELELPGEVIELESWPVY